MRKKNERRTQNRTVVATKHRLAVRHAEWKGKTDRTHGMQHLQMRKSTSERALGWLVYAIVFVFVIAIGIAILNCMRVWLHCPFHLTNKKTKSH